MSAFPQTILPRTIPGLVGWMDAADTSTTNITSSGGLVSQIANKANSQIPFVQGIGSNQPTTGTRTINGRNTLDFDGANSFLTANGIAAYLTGSDKPFSAFSVCLCDTPTTGLQNSIWAMGYSANSTPFQSQVYQNSQNITNRRDDAGVIAPSGATYISGNNVNAAIFTGTTISSYTNAATNYSGTSQDVGALTLDRFAVGATIRSSNTHFFDGIIGEFILYNRALTTTERTQIMDYLSNKWGVATR